MFASGRELTVQEVRNYAYVGRTYAELPGRELDSGFDRRAMTSHMEAIAILINSGRFLGYLPTHFAHSFVASGEMRSILDDDLAYSDTFSLVQRKDEKNRATALLSQCPAAKLSALT